MRRNAVHCLTALAAACCAWAGGLSGAEPPRVEIVELTAGDVGGLPVLPWAAAGDTGWREGEPLFEIASEEHDTAARGWLAVTNDKLLIRIVVSDAEHYNHHVQGWGLWMGDSIQLAVDSLGDGSDVVIPLVDIDKEMKKRFGRTYMTKEEREGIKLDRDPAAMLEGDADAGQLDDELEDILGEDDDAVDLEGMTATQILEDEEAQAEMLEALQKKNDRIEHAVTMSPDDADFLFALASGKSRAWSYYHGRGAAGDKPELAADIRRDDEAGTTTYDIAIPWGELGTGPGASPVMKVSFQINDTDPGQQQNRIYWGKGVGGKFRPELFRRVAVGDPPGGVARLVVTARDVQAPDGAVEVITTVSPDRAYRISAAFGGVKEAVDVPPAAGATELRRFAVRAWPGRLAAGSMEMRVEVSSTDGRFADATSFLVRDGSMRQWYAFQPKDDYGPSVIGMSEWLGAPAGEHGYCQVRGDELVFEDGERAKFWGLNNCSRGCAPTREEADARATRYAKFGVNCVRMHKFTNPLATKDYSTQLTEDAWDRIDYYTAQLKKRGIYYGWSHIWGLRLKRGDRDKVLAYDEALKAIDNPESYMRNSTYGLVNFAPDLQDMNIALTVNMLNHRNPYTGLTYGEDPALAYIEFQNEDDIFFPSTAGAISNCPTYRADFAKRFCDWLREKYGDEEGLLKAWGEGSLGIRGPGIPYGKESLDKDNIVPLVWYWGDCPERRMLDCARFYYETQNSFYGRFAKGIRATGYRGALVGSCWQSRGPAVGHYYNLHSDYLVGIIDRHNYYSGNGHGMAESTFNPASMLWAPGSGLFSAGLQQVSDRPFALSEWISKVPNEWVSEGPVILAVYGMGLQGWDASYHFASGKGAYSPIIGTNAYDTETPSQQAFYPALSRMIYRGDVRQGDVISTRKVHVPSLADGRIGFSERVDQSGDIKSFGGDVPVSALAAGRAVIEFTETPEPTAPLDVASYVRDGVIHSNTGQLVWDVSRPKGGFFTVDTPGTKAVVGFPPRRRFELGDVDMTLDNRFAIVFVTSLEKDKSIAESGSVLVTALARARNTGMRYDAAGGCLKKRGVPPVLLEPVYGVVRVARPGLSAVNILDHDGRRTGRTLPVEDGGFTINGARDRTMYYEMVYE